MALLPFPPDAADDAADGIGGLAIRAQNFDGALQMLRAALGGGVVEGQREIALGGARQPLFDDFPRGEAVREGDDAEIVGQRGPQYRAAARSQTLSTPVTRATKAEGVKSPGVLRSCSAV